jgi:putative outer membrane efflux protein
VPFGVEENFSKKVVLKDDMAKLTNQNTEYQMALRQKEISKKTINLKRADLQPTVAGVVTYGTSNNTKMSELAKEKNYNGTIGLNLSWDLFDWGARKFEVQKAQKEYEIKEIEAEQALDNIKVNMKKVYYQLQALEKSLEAKRIAVEKAEEVYELEQERYNYNLITMKDLLDAETTLRQSRTDYESTRLNYYYLISRYGSFLD